MNVTVAIITAGIAAFLVSFLLGYVIIPWLHKLNFGQTILDIGPKWHKKKQGTPIMGGIMFIVGIIAALAIVLITDKIKGGDIILGDSIDEKSVKLKFYGGLLMALCYGLIGFADDYIKAVKKRNMGLTILQKSVLQILVICVYLGTLHNAGATYMFIPFVGNVNLGFFFWIIGAAALYCTVNAANFTDGVDGLCASVTAVCAISLTIIAILRKNFGMSLLTAAVFGALCGYLIWNWYPGKVMMGDLGSNFLGGIVVAVCYALDMPWLILFVGIIYVIEFLSDIIQITYFKATHGKRIFKMAPIHHHFEMCGWKERKICYVFSAVNAVGGLIAILLTVFGAPK